MNAVHILILDDTPDGTGLRLRDKHRLALLEEVWVALTENERKELARRMECRSGRKPSNRAQELPDSDLQRPTMTGNN